MPEKAFSCGLQVSYSKKDYGRHFTCTKCGQKHFFPLQISAPKERRSFFQKSKVLNRTSLFNRLSNSRFSAIKVNLLLFFRKALSMIKSTINGFYPTSSSILANKNTSTLPVHLQRMQEELIQKTWQKDGGPSNLQLSPIQLTPPNWDACIQQMLQHAEKVAPQIAIPFHIPRLVFKGQKKDSGGTFEVDGAGYVTISIDIALQSNYKTALAVLAHELCHYILGSNGIKKEDRLANEQLTDVCMFVLGFGDVFLKGHRGQAAKTYGYLQAKEYRALKKSCKQAWSKRKTAPQLNSKEEELERWIISVVYKGNREHYRYTYKQVSAKYPNLSRADILDKIKYDYLR